MTKAVVYTDGGARGNPGPSAVGYVIYDQTEQKILAQAGEYIGTGTNNFAEYTALIKALNFVIEMGIDELVCRLDSELVVKQLKGLYKVREESLKPLAAEVMRLTNRFNAIEFEHILRAKNKLADSLVNKALDERADSETSSE
jgi:ribonuclease HI